MMRLYRRSPLYPSWGSRLAALLAKLPGSHQKVVKEVDGIVYELDLGDVIDSSIYYSGTFESGTEEAIESRLGPGMIAVDIGANIGYHTFRMARAVGAEGRVLAIEPMSRARGKLLRNVDLNNFGNIRVSAVGLTDEDCGIQSVAFENAYRLDGESMASREDVRLTRLDSLVVECDLPRVDFIKMDVDGYEGKVLRGARTVLATWKPTMVFEISPGAMAERGDSAIELVAELQHLGYRLSYEDGSPIADMISLLSRVGDFSINLVAEGGEQTHRAG